MSKKKNQPQKGKTSPSKATSKATVEVKKGFPPFFYNVKWLSIVLFVVSCLLYVGTLGHGFVQDDAIVLNGNEFTKNGDITSLLKYDTFRGFFGAEGKANLVEGGRYRPLTPIMFALGWKFTQSPFWFHLLNLIWYGGLVVMLFQVLLKLMNAKEKPYALFIAFVTSLLYAVHPLHTEVVANIKGRDEIVTLLFSLVALYFTLKAVDTKKLGANLLVVGVIFFLALMAKEMAVVFIPIMIASLMVFRKVAIKDYVIQTVPYVVSLVAFLILRGQAIGKPFLSGGGTPSEPIMEPMNNPFIQFNGERFVEMTFSEKFGTIFYTLGKYIQLLIFPNTLTHDYYPYSVPVMTFADPRAALPLFIYVVLIAIGVWGVFKKKYWAWGIAVFLISLFLVSNVPFPIGANMAERFTFIPSIGFCFVVALGLYELSKRVGKVNQITAWSQLKPAMYALVAILLFSSFKTITRSQDWKSNFSLFQADWKKSENSAKVRNAMGGELTTRSQDEGTKGTPKEKQMLREALTHLDVATKIHPFYKGAYLQKGNANLYLGNYDESIKNYTIATQIDPNFQAAIDNLKIAQDAKQQKAQGAATAKLEQEGIQASNQGDFAKAERIFTELAQKNPNEPKFEFFIGLSRSGAGNLNGALESFLKAEQKDNKTDVNNTNRIYGAIANTYTQLGNPTKAAEYQAKIVQ